MTNTIKRTTEKMARNFVASGEPASDHAPMVVTRLSGWIDIGESKTATPVWIVPTRIRNRH